MADDPTATAAAQSFPRGNHYETTSLTASGSTPATAALIPAWSYTRLGWVRIYLRCPDHGPFCSGPECCCRDLHWRPWALARCGRWRSLRGRMFPTKPRTRRV